MRARTRFQALAGAMLGVLAALAAPAVAHADPPGPTDFESTIVAVEPAVDGLDVTIIAGDAFFAVAADRGVTVAVTGYQGEPYLEFAASGEVRENRNSPTYFASRSKAGSTVPPEITAESPPEWVVVADDGHFAWHDHRTHWMGGTPTGDRGDVVARGTVPLTVDGAPVEVRVETRWLPAASPLPALAGAAVGVVLAFGYVVARRRRLTAADGLLLAVAAGAVVVGWIQYRSVPAVTEPSVSGWAIPGTALLASAAGAAAARRPAGLLVALGAYLVAGIELAIWAFTRRAGLVAASLPTDAPHWLDRAATTSVGVVGVVAAGLAGARLVELVTRPAGVSATARPRVRT